MFNNSNRNKKTKWEKGQTRKRQKTLFSSKLLDYKKLAIKEWDIMGQNALTYKQGSEKLQNNLKLSLQRVLL